jgi:hypothetical protein
MDLPQSNDVKNLVVNIVTYSGFSIHDGTLLHSKSQLNTVGNSPNTRSRPTRMVPEH